MTVMNFQVLLFIGLLGSTYSYFIYPLTLLLLNKIGITSASQHNKKEGQEFPFISFIITAYNEETHIKKKLENTLLADYPAEKLEIIVASDGSTDGTNSITQNYKNSGIILHPVTERKGKENAQRSAIQIAKGSILVFSDVTTQIEVGALIQIAKTFRNTQVGAISSEDRFLTEDGKIAGEGAYVKYEMWLRNLEGKVNSLVGLSGSFFAARKEICQNWDIKVPSDFNTALNCVRQGFVAVSNPELLGYYPNLKDETKEYQRKVRTVIRGIAALFTHPDVLNPFKFGLFSFQIFGHKIMRWLVPWFLIITLLTNVALIQVHYIYQALMFMQIGFYLLAISGWLSSKAREMTLVKIPYFFIQVNIAIAHALLLYLGGKRVTVWTPSKR